MTHLMKKVRVECLIICKLCFLWDDNFIFRNAIISIVAARWLDWTDIQVLLYHRIDGRYFKLICILMLGKSFCLVQELLIEFGARFLQVCLIEIKDVIRLKFGIYVPFGTFFLAHLLIIVILHALFRLGINHREGCQHYRRTLFALFDTDKWKFLSIFVRSRVTSPLFILCIIQ